MSTATSKQTTEARIIRAVDVALHQEASDILERSRLRAEKIESEALSKAQSIIDTAHITSKKIIENAEADGEKIKQNIENEVRIQANAHAAESISIALSQLQEEFNKIDRQVVSLVEIALRKIIGDIDQVSQIEKIVSQGLAELKEVYSITLQVHPSSLEAAEKAKARIQARYKDGKGPMKEVETAPNILPGECMLVSSGGVLNISIETQIEKVVDFLLHAKHGVS